MKPTKERTPLTVMAYEYKHLPKTTGTQYKDLLRNWILPSGIHVLDLASGRGEAANYLTELFDAHVVRTDISFSALKSQNPWLLKRLLGAQKQPVALSTATEQPFKSHSFDAIHMKDALVHIEDKELFFREVNRLLRPGGKLLIVTQHFEGGNSFFLHTNKKDEDGNYKQFEIPFSNIAEYIRLSGKVIDKNMTYQGIKITKISPPYFDIEYGGLIQIGKRYNLVFRYDPDMPKFWIPSKGQPDWYNRKEGSVPRAVLEFVKTSDADIRRAFANW